MTIPESFARLPRTAVGEGRERAPPPTNPPARPTVPPPTCWNQKLKRKPARSRNTSIPAARGISRTLRLEQRPCNERFTSGKTRAKTHQVLQTFALVFLFVLHRW